METQTLTNTKRVRADFTNQNIYVGFDVHLKSWKVTIMTEKLLHKTFSQPPSPELLHQYLVKNFPGGNYHSAYEAGFCGYWIHNKLLSLGINSIVVNPADIPTTDKEKVQKEDARDSRKIAKSLRNGDLIAVHVPNLKTLDDRSLLRTRATLVKDLVRNKNRTKSFLYFHGIEIPEAFSKQTVWSKAFINWLQNIEMTEQSGKKALTTIVGTSIDMRASVLRVTKQIKELSQTKEYNENVTLLKSLPGIGLITAMTVLTELETIERFKTFDKLCSFIGLIPSTNSSGEKDAPGNITRRGHSILRNILVESAWVAVRTDPALTLSYHTLCKRMEPNKAIVRIAKKLLNRIKFVLKNKQAYEYAVVK